jgi:hypothetical protein
MRNEVPVTRPTAIPATWPADKVERRKVADLVPYARNARTHSAEQVDQIARSIEEFGFTNPVLIASDGTIIAGHGRVLAAKQLGLETIPTMVADGWSDEQRRAYTIADNQLALLAGWDEDLLRLELGDLKDAGFDIDVIGFAADEITDLLTDPSQDVEPIEFAPGESTGTRLQYLEFANYRIPIDAEELTALVSAITAYSAEKGTTFGFAAFLLRGAKP